MRVLAPASLARLAHRVRLAAVSPVHPRHLFEALIAAALFAVVALPVALADGFLPWPLDVEPLSSLLPLGVRLLLAPALLEEVTFRVLPNPRREESPPRSERWSWALLSVAAYVAAHPLAALASPERLATFASPHFLLLTAMLGAGCLLLYLRSGSLWPPLLLHWLVAFGWLGLGGNSILNG